MTSAVTHLERAVELHPAYRLAFSYLAVAQLRAGDLTLAVAAMREGGHGSLAGAVADGVVSPGSEAVERLLDALQAEQDVCCRGTFDRLPEVHLVGEHRAALEGTGLSFFLRMA